MCSSFIKLVLLSIANRITFHVRRSKYVTVSARMETDEELDKTLCHSVWLHHRTQVTVLEANIVFSPNDIKSGFIMTLERLKRCIFTASGHLPREKKFVTMPVKCH